MPNKKDQKQDVQKNLFGNDVNVFVVKETYRVVKCGNCGMTVKTSQAKTSLMFGDKLTICNRCIEEDRFKISRL